MKGGELPATERRCANCGTPLDGPYCFACGQRHEPHIHSLWHFISEATESITHADSRLWRTLFPLLFRPGFLTKEFLEGRRVRYLPPFRLYLVLSVVFFLLAVAGGGEVRLLTVSMPGSAAEDSAAVVPLTEGNANETPEQRANRVCGGIRMEFPGSSRFEPHVQENCRKIVKDGGRGVIEAFYHNVPRGLIVLLPLLALAMRALYPRRFYVEHLLFLLHTHSFAFLFLTFYMLLIRITPWQAFADVLTLAMIVILPYYTYRAMRCVYEQRQWITRLKFTALAFSYLLLGAVMVTALGLYTMVTL